MASSARPSHRRGLPSHSNTSSSSIRVEMLLLQTATLIARTSPLDPLALAMIKMLAQSYPLTVCSCSRISKEQAHALAEAHLAIYHMYEALFLVEIQNSISKRQRKKNRSLNSTQVQGTRQQDRHIVVALLFPKKKTPRINDTNRLVCICNPQGSLVPWAAA